MAKRILARRRNSEMDPVFVESSSNSNVLIRR